MARSLEADQATAFQRFGLGAKKGSRTAIGKDPRAALLAELSRPSLALIKDPALPDSNAAMLVNMNEQKRINEEERPLRQQQAGTAPRPATEMMTGQPNPPANSMGMDNTMGGGMEPGKSEAPKPANKPPPRQRAEEQLRRLEMMARFKQGFDADIGLVERLVMFWSNHFCVSVMKGAPLQATAGAFEREAIRPFVLGRFEDMLLAVEKHQAMLIFLDNRQSIGPDSRAGQNRKRGLNENLAREILELHTLGVDGGYTQADVTGLANVITGWTIVGLEGNLGQPGTFVFNANAHQPGAHTILGKTYPEAGLAQGIAALKDIAAHPSTARFIARKLVRHFIADEPPKALAAKLEKTFLETRGDLAAVSRTLISADEAWSAPPAKLRSPYEFVMAAARLTSTMPADAGQIMWPLGALGQQLWSPMGPNGFSDTFAALAAPEAMKTRLEISWNLARKSGAQINPFELAEDIYGAALSPDTMKAIGRAETKQQGLAILLMSPEFQRR